MKAVYVGSRPYRFMAKDEPEKEIKGITLYFLINEDLPTEDVVKLSSQEGLECERFARGELSVQLGFQNKAKFAEFVSGKK